MDAFLWSGFVSVVSARHCKRAYLDRPVRRELLERALSAATGAPSNRNGQPWHLRGVDVFTVRDGKVAAKLAYVKG